MQTIVCFVLILTVSVAEDLDVYVYNSYNDYINQHEAAKLVGKSPFKFDYHRSDMLSMNIYLKNVPPNGSADLYLKYPSGVNTEMVTKKLKTDFEVNYFKIRHLLKYYRFIIDVQIFTRSGFCTRKIIAKGRKVSDSSEKINNSPHPDACLTSDPCIIEVGLLNNICGDSYKPDRSQNYPLQSTDRTLLPQPNIDITANKSTGHDSSRPVTTVENGTTSMSNATTSPHENIATTTIKSTTTKPNLKTTNYTVIIISSLCSIAFILLAIIAIWKRCWIKHSSQGAPGLPTIQQSEPFYLNMLFRRECDQEIAEIEQHHYEEIIPQVTEGG